MRTFGSVDADIKEAMGGWVGSLRVFDMGIPYVNIMEATKTLANSVHYT